MVSIMILFQKTRWKIPSLQNLELLLTQPPDEYLAKIYSKSSGYFATAYTDLSKTSPSGAEYLHKLLLTHDMRVGRFLDVGCSTGRLMYHLKNLGWDVAGIDIDADAAKVALKNNLNVTVGILEKTGYPAETFDVIHMGDVIEYVRSPRQMLLTANKLLRPGGMLIINTPNASCGFAVSSMFLAKMLRFPWPHSEAPYHLYEFSPETLKTLLTSTGFEVVRLSCAGSRLFMYTVGGTGLFDELKVSMNLSGKYKINLNFIKNIPKLIMVSSLLLPFYVLGRFSDALKKTGPKIFLIARKL
jgi:2-polyprenyl-3-methyl-5-hydroxy-6-metoxy-1,4-benzoquinol methylase